MVDGGGAPGGRLSVTGGFGHDGVSWRPRQGKEWTTPMLCGLYTVDGFGGRPPALACP